MNLHYLLLNFLLFIYLFETGISNSNFQSIDNEIEIINTLQILNKNEIDIINEKDNYLKEINLLKDEIDQLNDIIIKRSLGASSGGGSTVHSAFGALKDVDVRKTTLSILAVVVGVLCVELFFHKINHIAIDTPFESILNSVQKELMIVGCMAFVFKIVLQLSTFIALNWLIPLEFADLLIPITSFLFCTQALFMILISIQQCRIWSRAYQLHLNEIIDEFYEYHLTHLLFIFRQIYFPIAMIHEEIEFRIFHSIFCNEYQIKKCAFAFDEYVQRVFEKLLMDTLKIEIFDWFIILLICFLNWGRSKMGWDMITCDVNDKECNVLNSLQLFLLFGIFIFSFVLFLTISARIFQIRLLNKVGIKSCNDYTTYLEKAEKLLGSSAEQLSEKELKTIIQETKEKLIIEKSNYHGNSHGHGDNDSKSLRKSLHRLIHFFFGTVTKLFEYIVSFIYYEAKLIKKEAKREKQYISKKLKDLKAKITNKKERKQFGRLQEVEKLETSLSQKRFAMNIASNNTLANHSNYPNHASDSLKNSKFISDVFWFGKPEWFFDAVEVFTMIISFYCALWIVNYSFVANSLHHDVTFWKVITIVPGIICFILYIYLIKVAALLRSIAHIDNDIVESTMEIAENAQTQSNLMRTKILDKLEDYNDMDSTASNHDKLEILMKEIDDDDSRSLSRRELQAFLEAIGITLSRSRWRVIFREIDRNNDNQISYDELFLFLFPHDKDANAAERKRLRRIGARRIVNSKKYEEGKKNYFSHLKYNFLSFFGLVNDDVKVIPIRSLRTSSIGSLDSDEEMDTPKKVVDIKPLEYLREENSHELV